VAVLVIVGLIAASTASARIVIGQSIAGIKLGDTFRFGKAGQLEQIGLAYTLGAGGPVGATGAAASLAPGVYVSGPAAIEFNRAYSYQVTVLTNRSYRRAAVGVTTFGCSHKWSVNLTAHRPWRHSFPMIFTADNFRELPAVLAAVVSPATKKPPYAHTLFHARFPLTALPTAPPAEPPPSSYPFCDAPGGV
jgi:hypothetical protein